MATVPQLSSRSFTIPPLDPPLFPDTLVDRALFTANFPHTPFLFRHSLDTHPAFQLEALLEAAERINADPKSLARAHFESGAPDRNAWFGARPEGETLVSALASIHSGQNWVILKRIHQDPTYKAVLDELIPELATLTTVDIPNTFYDPTMTIFITSPGRVTPYHMDGETNFLAQIRGTKAAYIYDGRKPEILTPQQLEKYWTGNLPKIDYPESLPHGNWQYALAPGNGVFNPAIFPHWLQNGPEVSISVSINIKRKNDEIIAAHRTNHFLRRTGLTPTQPGQSPTIDRAKEATFGRLYQAAESTAKTLKSKLKQ